MENIHPNKKQWTTLSVFNTNLAAWIQQEARKRKGNIKEEEQREKWESELWAGRQVGRVAGTAESCDSTQNRFGVNLHFKLTRHQPAMPESCWFAFYSSPLSLLSLCLVSPPAPFILLLTWLTAVILLSDFYLSCRFGLLFHCIFFVLSLSSTLSLLYQSFFLSLSFLLWSFLREEPKTCSISGSAVPVSLIVLNVLLKEYF